MQRLCYEPLAVEHAQDLFPMYADPAIYEYISDRPAAAVADVAARICRLAGGPPADRARELWWNFVVRRTDSGVAIGLMDVTLVDDRAEVGYVFGSAHWGRGYATEAVEWLHQHLRERSTAATFWATVLPGNARSIRLLQRLGYAPASEWPALGSYHAGDLVYTRPAVAR